jgi:hypothetical protein
MSKYLKVLKQIDKRMTERGYKLVSVSDGYEKITSSNHTKTELYEWATQCDLGTLLYITPHDNLKKVSFYLVYGNLLSETIADMGYNDLGEQDAEEVSNEVAEFYEEV